MRSAADGLALRAPTPVLAALLALLAAAPARAVDLTPREQAGKRVYLTGESPTGGEIVVKLGRDGSTLPGTAAPCGSCHGADGQGRPEGGVRPSAVIWSELAKPYGHTHPGGRKHPPFTGASLGRALRDGLDPAGNPLDVSMPRYALSDEDLGSLTAYLLRLEEDLDPGISATSLRIGTVLPTAGALADVGQAMRGVLEGFFEALDRRGGVHGRKVELVVAGYDSDGATGVDAARKLLREGRVLALVSGFFPAGEEEVLALLAADRTPLVGPFGLFAPPGEPANPWVFRPLGGVREQARALSAFAAREPGLAGKRVAVVHAADAPFVEAARAAGAELRRRGGGTAELLRVDGGPAGDAGLAARLRAIDPGAVIVIAGDGALASVARDLAAARLSPALLAPGTLSSRDAAQASAAYRGAIYLAFPSAPGDETPSAAKELARLRERSGSAPGHRASQVSAFVDATVLVEGLRRAGRALSREKLVESLEALHDFETGLAPPIGFGPDRRLGAPGAHIVKVEGKPPGFRPVGNFVALEPD